VAASYNGTIDPVDVRAIVRAFNRESDAILGREEPAVELAPIVPIELPNEPGIPSSILQTLVAFTGGPVVVVATHGDCITTQARGYHSQQQVADLLKYAMLGVENPGCAVTEEGILVAPMQTNQ
jgi:hypothetical protein